SYPALCPSPTRRSSDLDFCRRWGGDYKYMVVLDADSVMSGECLSSLVRLMEANPDAGIIQTGPKASGMDTLYARMQQFATRVYRSEEHTSELQSRESLV